ncbi:MAG: hypothetical protein U0T68_06185 [Ferruginibacter sp.]
MFKRTSYHNDPDEQVSYITRVANNSIISIWIAGGVCIVVFLFYFLWLPVKSTGIGKVGIMPADTTEALFEDKTALLNIGLRMQSITYSSEDRSSVNIITSKIIHDKKAVAPRRTTPTDFSIKAVPK